MAACYGMPHFMDEGREDLPGRALADVGRVERDLVDGPVGAVLPPGAALRHEGGVAVSVTIRKPELSDARNDPARSAALGRLRNALARILRDHRAPSGVAADSQNPLRRVLHALVTRPPLGNRFAAAAPLAGLPKPLEPIATT
jgi:hypothetical protein